MHRRGRARAGSGTPKSPAPRCCLRARRRLRAALPSPARAGRQPAAFPRLPERTPAASQPPRLGEAAHSPFPAGIHECRSASGRESRRRRRSRGARAEQQQQLPHSRPLRAERAAGMPRPARAAQSNAGQRGGRQRPRAANGGAAPDPRRPPRPAGRRVRPGYPPPPPAQAQGERIERQRETKGERGRQTFQPHQRSGSDSPLTPGKNARWNKE
ncbi:translation initiation factor IF-2-like [Pipra filicauda]|uniref:Translation initiation factor IF-2-like n=1 Tax=Pipra filicauda TaxID=649802 RepID=A0A7R5KKH2_9PASS|nr:translation initiation factor IF-2-like [Pipra filicauda]